jgi:hypothetical protein
VSVWAVVLMKKKESKQAKVSRMYMTKLFLFLKNVAAVSTKPPGIFVLKAQKN